MPACSTWVVPFSAYCAKVSVPLLTIRIFETSDLTHDAAASATAAPATYLRPYRSGAAAIAGFTSRNGAAESGNAASRHRLCVVETGVCFSFSSSLKALSPITPGTFGARTSAPAKSTPSKVFSSIVDPFRLARRTSAPPRSTALQSKLSEPSWPLQLAIRTSAPPVSAD